MERTVISGMNVMFLMCLFKCLEIEDIMEIVSLVTVPLELTSKSKTVMACNYIPVSKCAYLPLFVFVLFLDFVLNGTCKLKFVCLYIFVLLTITMYCFRFVTTR